MAFPRLLGDIGGTNARWAWQQAVGNPPTHVRVYECSESGSASESAHRYLAEHDLPLPKAACLGVATPVTGDHIQFTNNPWKFSIKGFKSEFGLEQCLVINDFTALALSLPALKAGDLRKLGSGTARPDSTIGLIGPGTGLGVSGLVPKEGGWTPISGEGGHVTLAATNTHEFALVQWLSHRFGHVSAERVLSGQGLVNLYEAVCAVVEVRAEHFQPKDVTANALGGNSQCLEAVRVFTALLGNVAGNLALTLGAHGGIYLGGGIIAQLGDAFDDKVFRQNFESKGRFSSYLEGIPTWLITAPTPALLGAARALDSYQS